MGGGMGGGMGFEFARRMREKVRGEYRFSSLIKQKKKGGEIALSFASPEKEKYFLFIYEVITWEKIYKRSTNPY